MKTDTSNSKKYFFTHKPKIRVKIRNTPQSPVQLQWRCDFKVKYLNLHCKREKEKKERDF